jgi:hypothetical protein
MGSRAIRWQPAGALAAALGAGALMAGCAASSSPAGPGAAATPRPGDTTAAALRFGWFHPGPAPRDWRRASLPAGGAVLSYPRLLRQVASDPGTVSVGMSARSGEVMVYLNVTPRQGGETLRNWPSFRLSHLREEGQRGVRVQAESGSLPFRGGQGRCVIDDYTTRVSAHHYREIACLVQGRRGANVLIAAAPGSAWPVYGGLLKQAVSAYRGS